jgi:hypothetical protein
MGFAAKNCSSRETRPYGNIAELRQRHLETLHPQLVHTDLNHLGMKASSPGRKDFHITGLNGRLAW